MTAAAEAQVPVPEDVVGPTPRSKIRISTSSAWTMRTKRTLICFGNCLVKANLAAEFLPAASMRAKILIVHHDDEMRIAHGDLDTVDERFVRQRHLCLSNLGHSHAGGDLKACCRSR